MTDMLEKVAKAISAANNCGWDGLSARSKEQFLKDARTALQALREATPDMKKAINEADYYCSEGIDLEMLEIDPGILWVAGIDYILQQPSPPFPRSTED